MNNIKKMIWVTGATLALCLTLESISYIVLKSKNQKIGFFLNLDLRTEVTETKGLGFDEIDPLCGWSMSNKKIRSMGYEVDQNCEVLHSNGLYPSQPLKIFITGGSTSDIALYTENWPKILQNLLAKDSVNAVIYVGAVGGYSTGQELLKLMRDGMKIKPDIHISYAGANEGTDSGYISVYERDFYKVAYRQGSTTAFLPCTIFLLKSILHLGYTDLGIKEVEPTHSFDFWKENMDAMSGIASKNNYRFIGILQPVLGIGNHHQSNEGTIDPGGYSIGYKQYYPQAIEYIQKRSPDLHDFSSLFDTVKNQVFIDDCHIQESYQSMVAANVYRLLNEEGCIPGKKN